jgi:hypothetical protein
MDLYIHIGSNKTGSSYLQSTICLNKERLLKLGIYAPDSKWDKAMLKGIITPGNGHELALILASKDRKLKLTKYLERVYQEAKNRDCKRILLSNEILIRLFSENEILVDIENCAFEAGLSRIHFLIYLRNLYEHALSLYKHRAKFGKYPNYNEWFEKDYETLRLLKPLITNIKASPSHFTIVPFEKDSNMIVGRFSNWLKLETNQLEMFHDSVNPSLTLNQIKWVEHLNERYIGIAPKIYERLIEIKETNENERLVEEFYNSASLYFNDFKSEIQSLKSFLNINDFNNLDQVPLLKKANYASTSNLMSKAEFDSIKREIVLFSRFSKLISLIYYFKFYGRKLLLYAKGAKKNNLDASKFGGSLRN